LEFRATEEFKALVRVTKDHRDILVHRDTRVQEVLRVFLEIKETLDTKVYRVI
jgi:hypothetical protein